MMRRRLRFIYRGKLVLLLAALALTNLANEEAYITFVAAECEECEKKLFGNITFLPSLINVFQNLSVGGTETMVTATFAGKSADWSLTELPKTIIVSQVAFEPRVDSKSHHHFTVGQRTDVRGK